ncbi:hypothetical protein [Clostridium sp. Ade.TY]|uniref:hypothetical protein n=1 Tax=Clostridium sp. Ade.TY TaxID=1391647 RepID=UPI00040E167D|nr:hypothetical protein [Clostridium sp. Ade.TY]
MSYKFIPKKFIEKKIEENKARLNRLIKLILILNLILVPVTIESIKTLNFNREIKLNLNENVIVDTGVNIEEIESWMDILYITSNSGEIKNNKGNIFISNKKDIDYISKERKIEVIENKEDNGYYLEVLGR